jgi:hypothetical protein
MCCRWVLLAGLVAFSHLSPAAPATVFTGRYRLTLGTPDRPIDDATVWIYVIGWGSVERVKAGVIRGGVFDAVLDSAEVPVSSPEIFLAAIEFSDGRWYRGPDFPTEGANSHASAEEFVEGFDAYFRSLGRPQPSPDRAPSLLLPAFVERRITLLNEDGSPLVGRPVPLDVYVTQRNHCGVHLGLRFAEPLAEETTDERGQVMFVSQPGVALYLGTTSWPKVSPADSPWVWREVSVGIRTDTTDRMVIRRRWDEVERRTFTLEIQEHDGRPAAGYGVLWTGAGATCGFFGQEFGPTDRDGLIDMEIQAELTSGIQILRHPYDSGQPAYSQKLTELSEDQRGRLVRDGRLTVTLPRPKPPTSR